MKLLDELETKRFSGLKIVLFFAALTMLVTAVVIIVWEKFILIPFNAWLAAYYAADEGALYVLSQRIEHFFISTTVDVLIVTLLLRIVSRQQRRLFASEKRYRALFEHAGDGIGIIRASDHRLVDVNNKFCEIIGCQPKELVGRKVEEILRVGGGAAGPEPLAGLLRGAAVHDAEMELQRPGGGAVAAAVSTNEIKTDGERLIILIVRDLSERRRLEAEKEEMQRQLFQSSKLASVGELSAGVAHEINNPLNGIINFAQLLKDDGVARTEQHRRMIDGIIDEGDRIARIVRDLLTFARHDPRELTPVHIGETIGASMSLFGHQLVKDGVEVEIDIQEGLPPVMADASRLRQVVINMISNAHHALRAKGRGEKALRVKARAVERAGATRVAVEFFDSGAGIRHDDIDKVFDPFFTTRRAVGGTGLGLSLSFGIIREFGGTITVESTEGSHTRFVVELPAAGTRGARHEHAKSFAGGR
ncbi:MAG TPA: ATP-binding protein [Pyrinomonadaceae bacterium]|nr:ATP-binding protein [Pyrinomonadaceae bacterium]